MRLADQARTHLINPKGAKLIRPVDFRYGVSRGRRPVSGGIDPDSWMDGLSRNSAETLVCLCGNRARSCVVWRILACRNVCRLSIRVPGEYTTTLRVYDAI